MSFTKKSLSVLMCIVICLVSFPFEKVAIEAHAICCRKDGFDKSRYTLTGNMAEDVATIAKSQKGRFCDDFGYSGVDWGAWCDEFVADCIENAGADSSIVAHGGTVADFANKMRARGAIQVSTPQTGDLVFFTYSHVEIVTKVVNGVVYSAGGNNDDPDAGYTYHDGGCCKGEHKTTDISYYLRPAYTSKKWHETLIPANLGDSFDALILNKAAWIPIRTLSSTNVVTHPEEWVTEELWRFTRQLDGSYQILNWKNGLCLDANNFGTTDGTNIGSVASNNSTAQKWFIYSVNGGYVLRPSYGELAMDSWGDSTSNGNNVHLWTYQGHDGQLMSIYKDEAAPLGKPAPSAPTVTAVSDTSLSVTWSSTIYTDKYIVYRSTDNSTWIKLEEVTTSGYTDTGLKANTKYYYNYESVNRFYTVSSASASGTTKPVPAYTVKYNSNNGIGSMGDQTLIYDQAVNLTANAFSRTGYTFAGWNTKADGTGTSYADKASVKNLATGGTITLYAQWTANKYTVKFNGNGADELSTASKEVTYNSTYGELPNSIRAGYNFIGWYTQPEGGVAITPDTKVAITDTQTLYAQWSQVKFLITFNANGGTSEMRQKLVSSDNKYGVLPSAEKIGYEFGGWYLDEAFTKRITEDTIVKITKNQEVYAKWVQKKYTVTFEVNGGTVDMKTKKVVAGKVYGVLPEAEKNGFEFAGWFTESGKAITSDSIVELTADTVLYAKWRLRGDVDADGDVDVADVVLLQRWLLAGSTTTLNDWQAGDLCEDGRIDVFDLCLIKRLLIERIGD